MSVSGGRGVCGSGGISGGWGGLVLVGVLGKSIVNLLADLLGEGQLNILAVRGSKLNDALVYGDSGLFNLRDNDALVLNDVGTAHSDKINGL